MELSVQEIILLGRPYGRRSNNIFYLPSLECFSVGNNHCEGDEDAYEADAVELGTWNSFFRCTFRKESSSSFCVGKPIVTFLMR